MGLSFAPIMSKFEGYTIGKTLQYLTDPEIISFAGGLPASETFPEDLIRRASERCLREDPGHVLQYSPIPGEKNLIEAVIAYLRKDDIFIKPENILITTSGQHGLDMVGRLFLEPGDVVMADIPTFGGALAAFEMEDAAYIAVPIESDGSDVQAMERELKRFMAEGRTPKFIYVVPDFQNPSGITMSLEKRIRLLDISRSQGIPIIEDSPYRELRYKGTKLPSLFSLDENRGNVIGVYTFSKILCPGIRVGFNIGPAEVIKKFSHIKGANILCTPKLNQDICTAFLTEGDLDAHFKKAVGFYARRLDFFLDTLEKNFPQDLGVTWTKPEGGLFLWITVPAHINTLDLFHFAIKEKVAFIPGDVFYPKASPKYDAMRVNFSYPTEEQITNGVKRLSAAIRKFSSEA